MKTKPRPLFEVVEVETLFRFITSTLESAEEYRDSIESRGHRAIVKEVKPG